MSFGVRRGRRFLFFAWKKAEKKAASAPHSKLHSLHPCNPWFLFCFCSSYEVGGQRLAGFRGVSRRALPADAGFQPPLPEPDRHLYSASGSPVDWSFLV